MTARRMALCGLLTALAVVVMAVSALMGIGTFMGPVLAMAVLIPVYEEYGAKWALTVYAAAALLGLLLVPEPELAWVFTAFGWYPVVRPRILHLPSSLLRTVTRLVLCTAVCLLLYGGVLRLLGLTADLLDAAPLFNLLLLGMGNVLFLLLDLMLARITRLWQRKLRHRFFH